ncbi:PadR family transcriptional regulator [Rhizobium leguminosarum bv. viciae]|nr:PadR family transcriptional regulator [Rhizobium leguminosarum bv. viciae]
MAYVKRVFETDHHGADDGHGGDFMQDRGDIRAARMLLRSALRMRYPWSKPEAARIAGILERAATEIPKGGRPGTRG